MNVSFRRVLSSENDLFSDTSLIAFFVSFGLLLGVMMRAFHKKTNIPYTPVLLVLGIIGSIAGEKILAVGRVTHLISHIEPAAILLIFLPILIFESSFNADWHIFKRLLKQILLLAGPGVMISFALVAVTLKVILRYDNDELSWNSALMLGAIVAATDPVAIVALLKDLGAPHYFSTIVEGESLLNDGTGVVFFTIFSNLAAGKGVTAGLGIASILFLCVGGIALGLGFSIVTSVWLEKTFNDSTLSITITITASYLLYWVSESIRAQFSHDFQVGVSGILALCTFGLYLSAFSKVRISRKAEHPLHAVVGWIQYVSETLIFLLTGILVGGIFIQEEHTVKGSDWWKLILFFIMLNLIRAALVAILSPILNRLGHKLNFKELFILSYAGLRGALGLSLALTVNADKEGFSQRTRELILFYVAGVAGLSLLINGTTTQFIVNKIRMVKKFPAKEKIFRAVVREIEDVSSENYEKLREENPAAICDWDVVKKITGVTDRVLQDSISNSGSNILLTGSRRRDSFVVRVDEEELKFEARCRFLHMMNSLLWERYDRGEIETYGANTLSRAVKVSMDYLNKRVKIFEFLYTYFVKPSYLSLLTKLSKIPLIGRYFKNLILHHMVFIYDVTTSLVEIIDDLKSNADRIPLQEFIVQGVLEEFIDTKNEASSYLNKLEEQFLEVIKYVTTKRYTTRILMSQKNLVIERYNVGAIETKEYDSLIADIDKKMKVVQRFARVKWEPPTFANLITSYPVFSLLTKSEIEKVVATSKKVKFKKGELLFEEGKTFDGIYLITRGEVKIKFNMESFQRGVGHVILFFNLVTNDNISCIGCVAHQNVEAQKLDIGVLREVMKKNKAFEERVYKRAFWYQRFIKAEKALDLPKMSDANVQALMRTAKIVHFVKGDAFKLPGGGFLIKGLIKRNDAVYYDYYYIPKNKKIAIAHSEGLLLMFEAEQPIRNRASASPTKMFMFSEIKNEEPTRDNLEEK